MKALIWICGASLMLSACTRIPEPTYAAPKGADAKSAYARALRVDVLGAPLYKPRQGNPAIDQATQPLAMTRDTVDTMNVIADDGDRISVRNNLAALSRVALSGCEWTALDPDKVDKQARARVEAVPAGFHCQVETFYNTQARGMVSAQGEGWFYRDEGGWIFAGGKFSKSQEVG